MERMKRVVSLLLCFVMVVGLLPMGVFAADSGTVLDAAIFCSDVHGSTSNVSSVFSAIKNADGTFAPSSASFVGDTQTSASSVTTAAQTVYPGLNCLYAYGSHDSEGNYGIENKSYTLYEGENYYVYTISDAVVRASANGTDESTVQAALDDFASATAAMDKTLPLFIVCHAPLHARRGDNEYAQTWATAINEVAASMDVVYLWGHNHTGDNSVDQGVYYVAKGELLNVETLNLNPGSGAGQSSSSTGEEMTINFTYMNAGYIGKSAGRGGLATTVKIYADKLVFQDYNSSGAYTGSHAHNVEVAREFAVTTPTINTVTNNTTYVDDDGVVKTNGDTITATGTGLTGVSAVWNDTVDLSEFDADYTCAYDVTLEGYTEGDEVTLVFDLYNVTSENMVVYSVAEDGTLVPVEFTAEDKTSEEDAAVYYVSVTMTATADTATYIIGVPGVEQEAVLTGISVTSQPEITKYTILEDTSFDGNLYLDITGLEVTATYDNGQTDVLDWDRFGAIENGYALGEFDMYQTGTQTITVTYGGYETSFDIVIYQNAAEDVSADETVAAAVAEVLAEGYVAQDITLTDYTQGDVVKVVMAAPADADVVYYVSETGELTEITTAVFENGVVIFTTDHFSTYVVGNSSTLSGNESNGTVPGQTGVTTYDAEEVTVYKLVAAPVSGQQYLIVNSNTGTGYGLDGDTTGYATTAFTGGSDYYSSWDSSTNTGTAFAAGSNVYLSADGAYLWTAGSNAFTIGYSSESSGSLGSTSYTYTLDPDNSTTGTWNLSNNQLSVSLVTTDSWWGTDTNTTYYLSNSGSTWSMSTSGSNVYFYEPVTVYKVTTSTTDIPETTYHMDITLNGTATQEITAAFVKAGDTCQLGAAFTPSTPEGGTWAITSSNTNVATVDNNGLVTYTGTEGETLIQATYTWTVNDKTYSVSNYVSIVVTGAIYTVTIDNGDSHIEKGVTSTSTEQLTATVTVQTSETETSTVTDPTITWEILADESDANVATINASTGLVSFTGTEGTIHVQASYVTGGKTYVDIIEITAKKSTAITPSESTTDFPRWPNEGAVRFDKTASAVGNFSETGIAQIELSMAGIPTGGAKPFDVVLMLDMSNSMNQSSRKTYTISAARAFLETICLDDDGNWNGLEHGISICSYNIDPQTDYPTNTTTSVFTDDMVDVTSYDIYSAADTAIANMSLSSGTDYAEALQHAYNILKATKDPARDQYLIFMTDGKPTSYAYIASSQAVTSSKHTASTIATGVYTEDGTTYNAYLLDQGTSTGSNYELDTSTLKNYDEYYSYLMKQDGVEIYTVGLATEDDDDKTILSHISSAADTETTTADNTHAFFIDDGDNTALTNAFVQMGEEMMSAATNVNVEDVITPEYEMIFELPNSNITGLPAGQEFYIEVLDYPLDETTHERTGTYTTTQRIYLATGTNGVYISKITEGTTTTEYSETNLPVPTFTAKADEKELAYFTWTDTDGDQIADAGEYTYNPDGDGSHHLTSGAYVVLNDDGSLKSLHTVAFTYVVAEKKLNWTVTSMSQTSETALRYFVYLRDSGGVDPADQIDAGTYPTNVYATLNYTNHLGNECEQEFPIPQMTWNGAQVSYVFYLVNDQGVPVNRAGREVTFAEAVFVTDIYTYAITWNDLEQAAGLEAEYLASDKLPDAYTLYDTNAKYNIHVYEDEEGVNLNNHFIISGTDGDTTTYVYNNKTDVTKYNEHGTYAATSTYLCKSYDVTGATYTTGTDAYGNTVYTVTAATYSGTDTQWTPGAGDSTTGGTVIDGHVYYVDENGEVYTIVQKSDATAITGFDFANTTVAFAVKWERKLVEDTVVVDFGLPVDIDVVSNDFVYNYVTGIGASDPNYGKNIGYQLDAGALTASALELQGHSIKIQDQNHIRFTPGSGSSLEFDAPVTFYYETTVEVYEDNQAIEGFMYSSVTVIPATTVYYEDTFVDYTVNEFESGDVIWQKSEASNYPDAVRTWTTEGTAINGVQASDRPGQSQISDALDADNNYGYDSAYDNMSTYSMGSATKIQVDSSYYGEAKFSFYGTGFDVISMTDNTTGTILVTVTDASGAAVRNLVVDTYYGYTYNEETGAWETTDAANAIYQVPVISVDGLTYGKYNVTIRATYNKFFDNTDAGSYWFYLDAIRIYDPVDTSVYTDAGAAYEQDGEGWPVYTELRNNVIEAATLTDGEVEINGIAFMDGVGESASVTDYMNYGPNNELYLMPGQAIAFNLDLVDSTLVKTIQLGIKSADGAAVTYKIFDAATVEDKADLEAIASATLTTATDMYYDITSLKGKTIVIYNAGTSGTLSLTNVKVTYTADPGVVENRFYVSAAVIANIVNSMNTEKFNPTVTVAVPESVYAGNTITVTVTTSNDVAAVSVNGEMLSAYSVDGNNRVWTGKIATSEAGTVAIEVVAYDADGRASETPVTASVEVKSTATQIRDFIDKLLGWLLG